MLARHHEKADLRSKAAATYLEAADVARVALREREGGGVLRRRARARARRGGGRDGGRTSRRSTTTATSSRSSGSNDEALVAFREMLTRAFRLDLRGKGGAAHTPHRPPSPRAGRLADATLHLEAALTLFEEAGDERGIASAIDDIGKLHWLRGDYPRALEFTQKGLVMRRQIGDRRSIALSLEQPRPRLPGLGAVPARARCLRASAPNPARDRRSGRRHRSRSTTSAPSRRTSATTSGRSLSSRRRTRSRRRRATGTASRSSSTNLGETHNRLGDAAKAIEYLKQAEELADELGDKLGLAEALRGLGKAYLARREYTKARECTARAVELFTEVQSKVQLGVALRSLGEVVAAGSARGGEELKAARGHLLRSIAIFEEIGNEVELARSCRSYAETLKLAVDLSQDAPLAREAASFAKRADDIFAKLRSSSEGLEAVAFFSR